MAIRKQLWTRVGLGCVGLLLAGCCVGGGWGYWYYYRTTEPARHARAFFQDLRNGKHADALRRMDRAYQDRHDEESFRNAVGEIPVLTQHEEVTFGERTLHDGRATAAGTLVTPQRPVPFSVELHRADNDHWYIHGITVDGQSLR